MSTCIRFENASLSIGDISLFRNISFTLNEGEKYALIARNGAGKTTLLNIITGKESFDSGTLYVNKDLRISYLEQDPSFDGDTSVFDAVYGAPGLLMETVRNYELALHSGNQKDIEQAGSLMDFHRAWDLEARIRQMLGVLKLNDESQKVSQLSGGQIKRLALAVALIHEPDLLILDEPTNHLDLDMIEWLEDYLRRAQLSLLMVTHDRYFLDRVCNRIVEIDEFELFTYEGNYSYYLGKRQERLSSKAAAAEKARNLMRTELEWMRRMPKARTTKARYRIDAFYDLQKQAEYKRSDRQVDIGVQSKRLGKKILSLKNVSKSFGKLSILNDFNYTFSRGEKLGIIGANGTGKTSFLNIITGQLQSDSGKTELGETVEFGYYRQVGGDFKPGQRVIDVLKEIAEYVTLADGRQLSVSQFLTHFLFNPGMQHVQVEKLSGGEKRRLNLMTVLIKSPNFLILDEPTNDFDIATLNILEEYLAGFGGCLIIVSHDRFFMDKIVDHLFIFEGNGEIWDFPGNYSEYRASLKSVDEKPGEKPLPEKVKQVKPTDLTKLSYKEKNELLRLNEEIPSLEKEKTELENQMSSGLLSPDELLEKSLRIGELINQIDKLTERWMELSERE